MKKNNKTILWVVVVVGVAIGLLAIGKGFQGSATRNPDGTGSSGEPVPCLNPVLPAPPQYHIHPVLKIVADGKDVPIPTNLGISITGCERVVHTHDTTGTIHVEPNYYQAFTLGDFFWVWGKEFSADKILDYSKDAEHEIIMTVDGKPSTEYEKLVLKDKQQIIIEYKKVK